MQQIHAFLFGGLFDFAGQIREKSISKGGYQFVYTQHLNVTLQQIDAMPQETFDEIIQKYSAINDSSPTIRKMVLSNDVRRKGLVYCQLIIKS